MNKTSSLVILIFTAFTTFAQDARWDYLGQTPPGDTPELFAPGIISTEQHEHSSPTFSPDGNEIYWSLWEMPININDRPQVIRKIVKENGIWGTPQIASFSGKEKDGGPIITRDGKKLFIYRQKQDDIIEIVLFEKSNDKWSNPKTIVKGFSPSIADNGKLYYGEGDFIYKLEVKDDKYLAPKRLNEKINAKGFLNWTPFIAPDESYLIFSRCDESGDYGNLYICFKSDSGDDWTTPEDMGKAINTWRQERFPSVSPDGKYLFFCRSMGNHDDVFWVDAGIINELREKQNGNDR